MRTVIGKITSVYGIKGWVKIHSYTDPPENIFDYQPWHLDEWPGGAEKKILIDNFRAHGNGFVAHLAGIDDRDVASQYCQQLVSADLGQLPELPEGEYYWQQLKGLLVYCQTEQQPLLLGRISDLMETGANDVLVVSPCEQSIDQRERLLPYVESCVLEVDLESGRMLVDWDPEF